jgi:CBS domain-containing protein
MLIRQILAVKGTQVVTMDGGKTLRDAITVLTANKIGAVIVVDASHQPVGILSERDIIRAADRFADVFDHRVDEVMSRNVVVGSPSDDIRTVEQTMTQKRFRHLPVMDQGKLAGIISLGDIVKAQLEESQDEIQALHTYIRG